MRQFIVEKYLPITYIVGSVYKDLFEQGQGVHGCSCFGVFPMTDDGKTHLLKAGIFLNGRDVEFDPKKITEDLKYAWYDDATPGKGAAGAETNPNLDKKDAYSFVKAPRYDGEVIEVGPAARMWVANAPLSEVGVKMLKEKFGIEARTIRDLGWDKVFSIMGRHVARAEEALLNAVRNSPHLAEAYVQLGGICLERGDLEGCLRYNEEAAQCRAKFPVPWSNIAFVHLQRGEPDKAITALKKALKWDPDFVQAKNALTTAYYMQGDFEACEKLCKEILEKEPAFAPAWNNMALAQFDLGKYAEARQSAAKAAELGFEVPEGFLEELKAKGV